MTSTPRNHRHGPPHLATTASNSPITRNNTTPSGSRSPIKVSSRERRELGLSLERVIGTTCESVFCFDYLPSNRTFAYTAGAAAVVASVDNTGNISQRFFRANPGQSSQKAAFAAHLGRESYASPVDPRHRSPLPPKDHDRVEWSDSPTGNKATNIRDRVKASTAVGFSPDGHFLAVGETGYRPRVLVFSLSEKSSGDSPVSSISEHTFGVQAVAFSPDSRHLASLGTVNDGFLYIWSIDERGAPNLVASNKCTTSVRQMTWMGCSLITVGLRFVKVWRPNDLPASVNEHSEHGYGLYNRQHKPLAGRNALLGDMLEATFTCVTAFSNSKAIICTDGGDVCILDDEDKNQRLMRVANVGFSITAACIASASQLIVTGSDGSIKTLDLEELCQSFDAPRTSPGPPSRVLSKPASCYFIAVGSVGGALITVDNHHGIQLRPSTSSTHEEIPGRVLQQLPAHSDAVLGVRALKGPNEKDVKFVTWSANGTVIFWSAECRAQATIRVPLDQSVDMYNVMNELKTVVTFPSCSHALTGDKYGVLRISEVDTGKSVSCVRAHSSEITDIAVHDDSGNTLVASSSRDRTIQLLTWNQGNLDLLQTLDEHAGSVTCVVFAKDANQLLSCSADRTVVVREAMKREEEGQPIYIMLRTITLKNSPTCMRMSLFDDTVLLSATDRTIQLVSTRTGRVVSSFKASDTDGGDAVVMSSLVHLPSTAGPPIIAGVASSDKSIRMYAEDGTLLARDWGHTEGVTDIALLKSQSSPSDASAMKLVTVAADGTIFIWATVPERPRSRDSSDHWGSPMPMFAHSAPGVVSAEQPLRKVISQSEITRIQRARSTEIENDEVSSTQNAARESTGLKKKSSRPSVRPTRLEPSPLSTLRNGVTARNRQRSPSPTPPSPRMPTSPRHHPRSAPGRHRLSVGSGTSIPSHTGADRGVRETGRTEITTGFGSVSASTDQLSRMLRAYRQKLEGGHSEVPAEKMKELERELSATVRLAQRLLKEGEDISKHSGQSREEAAEDRSIQSSDGSRSVSSQDTSFTSARAHQEVESSAGAETT